MGRVWICGVHLDTGALTGVGIGQQLLNRLVILRRHLRIMRVKSGDEGMTARLQLRHVRVYARYFPTLAAGNGFAQPLDVVSAGRRLHDSVPWRRRCRAGLGKYRKREENCSGTYRK